LQAGAHIGPYELIRLLASRGHAEVWLARRADGAFKRETALKLPTLSRGEQILVSACQRVRHSRSLEHPHIARLYDAGVDSTVCPTYLWSNVQGDHSRIGAMRIVWESRRAWSYSCRCSRQWICAWRTGHPPRPQTFNILVTRGRPGAPLDFGVAKLLEADRGRSSRSSRMLRPALTPDYASPDCWRQSDRCPQRHLFFGRVALRDSTGVRPYGPRARRRSACSNRPSPRSLWKTQHAGVTMKRSRPAAPRRLNRQLRGDLDAIALKALAKEPAKRYQSAGALAEDLRRYLGGKPIEALPARFTDRLHKLVRRNKFRGWRYRSGRRGNYRRSWIYHVPGKR